MESNKHVSQTVYVVASVLNFEGLIREALPSVTILYFQSTGYKYEVRVQEFDDNPSMLKDIEILFATPYVLAAYVDKLVNLKWCQSPGNGADAITKNISLQKYKNKFILTKLPGSVNAPNTAEYVIGQIIARERNFLLINEVQSNKDWDTLRQKNTYRNMSQLTVGIMGLGGIGDYMARQCKALGMTVWGLTRNRRSASERSPYVDEYRVQDDLNEFLQNCDYICNVLPSTEETRHMLSGDVFKHCSSKGGVFINCGRGDVTDEKSIIRAIENKWLGGAILDCFVTEPLPPESPLWTLPGVTLTPHVSGWSNTTHRTRVTKQFAENYYRYVQNQPLVNVFDWEKGY